MNMFVGVRLKCLIYLLATCCSTWELAQSDSCDDINYLFIEDVHIPKYNIDQMYGLTFEECLQECTNTISCKSVDYISDTEDCSLNDEDQWKVTLSPSIDQYGEKCYETPNLIDVGCEQCLPTAYNSVCNWTGCGNAPVIDFAARKCYQNGTTGFSGDYTCKYGYEFPSGSPTATYFCSCGNETWESVDTCLPVDCGPPSSPEGAEMTDDVYTYPRTVTFTCASGYPKIGGDTTRTCQGDGMWSGSPIQCQRCRSCASHNNQNCYVTLLYGILGLYFLAAAGQLFRKRKVTRVAGRVLAEISVVSETKCALYCLREIGVNEGCQSFAFNGQRGLCVLQTEADATPQADFLTPDWVIYSAI